MAKTAWGIMVEAVLAATSLIAQSKDVHAELVAIYPNRLKTVVTTVFSKNKDRIMTEWESGVEAHLGHDWLKEMMNLQAHELGLEILKEMELI